MDPVFLIALAVLYLVAVADVWTSQLTPSAKVLWTINILCLIAVGLLAWLLTRHTAHQSLERYRRQT